jgi:hypothetical protein
MAQVVNEMPRHLRNHAAVRFSQRVCAGFVKNIPTGHSPQFFHQLGLAQTRHGASVQLALSQLISVPLALGQQQQVLRISRIEDQIQVERIPGV